ncbi:hypothetical protein [Variovorax sp. HJSM1_2]|uniref:hypothetical protein n=1 Tax=Variovorax sp. HJSM1_2 TaxID=3366263 RepID=UPI003BD481E0
MDLSAQPALPTPLPDWANDVLSHAILEVLNETPGPKGVSLPRMGKALGLGVSVLLRRLHLLSAASIGGQPGPAWVRVEQLDERWIAHLTDAGRAQWVLWSAETGE